MNEKSNSTDNDLRENPTMKALSYNMTHLKTYCYIVQSFTLWIVWKNSSETMETLNFWYNVTKLKTVPLTAVSTSLKRTIGFYGHNSVHCHCHKEDDFQMMTSGAFLIFLASDHQNTPRPHSACCTRFPSASKSKSKSK